MLRKLFFTGSKEGKNGMFKLESNYLNILSNLLN